MKKILSIMCVITLLVFSIFLSGTQSLASSEFPDDEIVTFSDMKESDALLDVSFEEDSALVLSENESPCGDEEPIRFCYDLKHNSTKNIPVTLFIDDSVQYTDISYKASAFTITERSSVKNGERLVITFVTGSSEAFLEATIRNGDSTVAVLYLYGLQTERGTFISYNQFNTWDAYYYAGVENGEYTLDECAWLLSEHFHNTEDRNSDDSCSSNDARTVSNINGTIKWTDDNGNPHPAQFNMIAVYDNDAHTYLSSTYTDENGYYSLDVSTSSGSNLYLNIWAAGYNSMVRTPAGVNYCKYEYIGSGSNQVYNYTYSMSTGSPDCFGQALQISQAINCSMTYVAALSKSVGMLYVVYPSETAQSCNYSNGTITIRSNTNATNTLNTYASWDMIMHEFGHHFLCTYGLTGTNATGTHGFNIELYNSYHTKDNAIQLAWSESLATVFSGLAQIYCRENKNLDSNIPTVGDAAYFAYNSNYGLNYESPTSTFGESCENSIIAVFWDMYDSATTNGAIAESFDNMHYSHPALWNLVIGSGATTMSAFVSYYDSNYLQYAAALGRLMTAYHIAPAITSYNTSTHVLTWAEYSAKSHPNTSFQVLFYSPSNTLIGWTSTLNSLSYDFDNLSTTLLSSMQAYTYVYAVVTGYQVDSPQTGPYNSAPLTIYTSVLPSGASSPDSLMLEDVAEDNSGSVSEIIEPVLNPDEALSSRNIKDSDASETNYVEDSIIAETGEHESHEVFLEATEAGKNDKTEEAALNEPGISIDNENNVDETYAISSEVIEADLEYQEVVND